MVEAHVAGLTGARVLGLGLLEGVPGVAGVALGMAVADLRFLRLGFGADLVAARAAFVSLAGDRFRLMAHHGHGARRYPREVVLARLELFRLLRMAAGAGFGRRHRRELRVVHLHVGRAVAGRAVDAFFPHLPVEVLLDDAARHFLMTLDAGALFRRGRRGRDEEQNKTEYEQNPEMLHAVLPPCCEMV